MLAKVILVPTDFSDTAEVALDYAVELAAKLDARVHLLHCVDLDVLGGEISLGLTPAMIAELVERNQAALGKLVDSRKAKVAFAPVRVDLGDARAHIDQEARRIGADLIVMGTHGRRGFKRLLLGSVAESVMRIAPCPVLLLRGAAS
jgi:nucleotide-binding universal stress UspA family protein